jgi:uncharacterized protein YndB with AHSA1/START domain
MTTLNRTNVTATPNSQNIVMTRLINAPRDRVFHAHVDPEIFQKWMGPGEDEMRVEELNVAPGGTYRYVHTDADGNAYGFRGVFHDVKENEYIVQTFEFEGMPGHICLEKVSFSDAEGGTLLTTESVYQSVEDRDGMLQSGMEEGASSGYDKLERLLAGS